MPGRAIAPLGRSRVPRFGGAPKRESLYAFAVEALDAAIVIQSGRDNWWSEADAARGNMIEGAGYKWKCCHQAGYQPGVNWTKRVPEY